MQVIAAVLVSLLLPVTPPPAGQVTIEKLKAKGSGCEPGTTTVALSPDRAAFTVSYSTYLAQAGAGSKSKDQRRNCGLTIRLNVPAQTTWAITAVDYRGFAHLEPGAAATLTARYHVTGPGGPSTTTHTFPSGLDDSWQVTDRAVTPAFADCGKDRKVDIDTELRATAPRADAVTSLIAMDTTDSAVDTTYHLTYRAC